MDYKLLITILVGLLIFAWFLLGEKKSFGEKIGVVIFCIIVFLCYKLVNSGSYELFLDDLKRMIFKG